MTGANMVRIVVAVRGVADEGVVCEGCGCV